MRRSASGEEDVLQYKHNTKKKKKKKKKKETHSAHAARALLSFLPRPPLSCRLAPSAPRLSSRPSYGKEARTGAKAAMPAFNKSSSSRACDISTTKRIRRWSGGGGRGRGAAGGGGGNEE